jgi:hypothetical protein
MTGTVQRLAGTELTHHPPGHDCGICRAPRELDETARRRRFRPSVPSWRPGLRSYVAAAFAAGALTVAGLYHTFWASPYSCHSYNAGTGYTCVRR